MFNLSDEMVKRQCKMDTLPSDHNSPIDDNYLFLEPSIEGSDAILRNDRIREAVRKALVEDIK